MLIKKTIVHSVFICFILLVSNSLGYTQTVKTNPLLDSLYSYIIEVEIQHPEIVFRQAILETGWLRSKFLVPKNNFFGFKRHGKYQTFFDWRTSVEIYKLWQQKHYTNPEENYYKFLRRMHYASSKSYSSKLRELRIPERLLIPPNVCGETLVDFPIIETPLDTTKKIIETKF